MMIESNLSPGPTFLASFSGFSDRVPFLCAGGLALTLTALLILIAGGH